MKINEEDILKCLNCQHPAILHGRDGGDNSTAIGDPCQFQGGRISTWSQSQKCPCPGLWLPGQQTPVKVDWGESVERIVSRLLNEAERPLSQIANEIADDWKQVNYVAKPYLAAMFDLESIDDNYGADSGSSIVAYFLRKATSWRGEKAKAIKKELKALLNNG